jgi:DNA-binding NtrC family response regulator
MPQISAILLHDRAGPLPELKAALEQQSVKTRVAATCREATCLLDSSDPPLLIFTDRQLRDGTWSDVVRLACQAATPASVIVVSQLVDVSFYLDTLDRGAFDFIVPPFESAGLAHVVQCGVDNALALRADRAHSAPKAT